MFRSLYIYIFFIFTKTSAPVHRFGVNGWVFCMPMRLSTYLVNRWIIRCSTEIESVNLVVEWCKLLVNLHELGKLKCTKNDVKSLISLKSYYFFVSRALEIRHWMMKNGLNIVEKIQFIEFSMLKVMEHIKKSILAKDQWPQLVHFGTLICHDSNLGQVITVDFITIFT